MGLFDHFRRSSRASRGARQARHGAGRPEGREESFARGPAPPKPTADRSARVLVGIEGSLAGQRFAIRNGESEFEHGDALTLGDGPFRFLSVN